MPRYALIDAARDPRLYALIQTEPDAACLFGGVIDPVLAPAAPYILPIRPQTRFKQAFQAHGWLALWGISCFADAPLMEVRRQLRKSLQAILPDGRVGLFRFYDPRVFVPMMQAASDADIAPWFGPITDYWSPHPETGATLRFLRSGDGTLRTQEMSAPRTARMVQAKPGSRTG
ncbi:DUF4123 domain-containing protein [Alphaproteobacteria bacterium KMM 3653]|uniref:DUF4123 domain-containing protein n=1 Tax=Harenicola maris TaxID=2841044 RepID=A0AAP2CL31_9RHOB|nr:DUF4123 domain-containing protein [Harenicola maris]